MAAPNTATQKTNRELNTHAHYPGKIHTGRLGPITLDRPAWWSSYTPVREWFTFSRVIR